MRGMFEHVMSIYLLTRIAILLYKYNARASFGYKRHIFSDESLSQVRYIKKGRVVLTFWNIQYVYVVPVISLFGCFYQCEVTAKVRME